MAASKARSLEPEFGKFSGKTLGLIDWDSQRHEESKQTWSEGSDFSRFPPMNLIRVAFLRLLI